jgi:hypothetical protein
VSCTQKQEMKEEKDKGAEAGVQIELIREMKAKRAA